MHFALGWERHIARLRLKSLVTSRDTVIISTETVIIKACLRSFQVGADVEVLCRVRARPCSYAVRVMKTQLKAEALEKNGTAGGGDEGDDTPAAKRRRLEAIFMESDSSEATEGAAESPEVIVAVRKGNIVATAFHPELTNDGRWHEYFAKIVEEAVRAQRDKDKRNPMEASAISGLETSTVAANVVA